MKKFVVRYGIGAYLYESEIRTSSSNAVFLWVESIGGSNPSIIYEEEWE